MNSFVPIFFGKVEEGKLIFSDTRAFNIWVEGLEGLVEVIVRPRKRQRTLDQNAYYWGVALEIISKETGHTPEELHEIFKRMFLSARVIEYRGKEIRVPGSTSLLSTKEFVEYIERVKVEAGEMGIEVPESNKVSAE